MSNKLEEFKKIIEQMFQFDQADLDFGIYRIMNQKRAEVKRFLDEDLLPQVKEEFNKYIAGDREIIQKQMDELKRNLENAGVVAEESPKYRELQEQYRQAADVTALENEVYSHLTNFFKRYYHNGDFLSLRRYKKDVYAIPYEGEEVKLYWANADQYYIKTSEYLRDYTFTLPSGGRVHFKLVEASTEQNNNKASNGKERRFILAREEPVVEENGELFIRFHYELLDKKTKQVDLNAQVIKNVFKEQVVKTKWHELATLMPTEKNKKRTLLEKHLTDYTARHTFDYFIHKDLGGFLRRELDFFIKNEIMHLDDLGTEKEVKLEQYIAKIRVVKKIGHKIILFLEQLENFQKKLWLKKKFVVETNYCITLDRVPEDLYPEIAANKEQVAEWRRLFAIEEIKGDGDKPGYSEPLTVEFLQANPYLVLDTAFFGRKFKEQLLASIDNLDEQIDGLLVCSENFQALNLLQERYREQVKCIYIDPPFNIGENADFLYKVDYKDSTWLSLLQDRLLLTKYILNNEGSIFIRCSHDGNMLLRLLMNHVYGLHNFRNEIIVRRAEESKGDLNKQFGTIKSITVNYDNIYWYSIDPSARFGRVLKPTKEEQAKSHWHSFWKAEDRPNLRYEILGIDLTKHYGQWMWKKERAYEAVQNYKKYLEESKITGESLDDYWARTGKKLEFIRRDGDSIGSIKYWIPPRSFVMADNNWLDIKGYANKWGFKTENSEPLLKRIIESLTGAKDIVLDFFLGSGTTASASHKLGRKWIGIEMGNHFDTIVKPRMKYVLYGEKSGISRETNWEGGGFFKYIRLESYEDTLNNLELKRTPEQDGLFKDYPGLREEYLLSYMLDLETSGSASLLNLDHFNDPFNYRLKIARHQEVREETVDLVETFNYLIGLRVQHIEPREYFTAAPNKRASKPGAVELRKAKGDQQDFIFQHVVGTNAAGEKVLVIWRTLSGDPVVDNAALDAYFDTKEFSARDNEFDCIYVNGDNNLANLSHEENGWKVLLIEEEFKRLMFDVQDV